MYNNNYGGKKNKSVMGQRTNNRISQREFAEFDINKSRQKSMMDVDRIMMERQFTDHDFNNSRNDDNDDDDESMDGNIYDKGMPVRSSFTIRKSKYDNNAHNDFDLFRKIKGNKNKNKILNGYDGYGDGYGDEDVNIGDQGFADIDEAMKPITNGNDPYEICISDINSTTCWFHSNMFNVIMSDYIVNGIGLFTAFGTMYLLSGGNTELELKNYFGYQDKKHLNAGILTLRENINRYRDQIMFDNYIINDMSIPSNSNVAKSLKKLIFNIVINNKYPDEESNRVNSIINTISKMPNVVSPNTISGTDISIITLSKIKPIWAYKIDNIVNSKFLLNGEYVSQKYVSFNGKTFNYHEDAEKQLLEMPLFGDEYVIGIVLNKKGVSKSTNLKDLTVSINYMKPTVLDEVIIPMIKKRYKTRLNKTLQKTGLNVIFNNNNISELFPEGGSLSDCIQYIDIDFGKQCGNKRCDNKGYRTTRKFICNTQFEYYLRNSTINCIISFGRY